MFQMIQLDRRRIFVYTQLNVKTVLFQTIQFSISTQFSSIWPIDRILSGATTPGLSEPGSDGNKGVLCIPQSFNITETSTSDCFVSYPGYTLQGGTPLQKCSWCILQPQPTGQCLILGWYAIKETETKLIKYYKAVSKVSKYFDTCYLATCISRDQNSWSREKYLLWLVVLW